MKIRIEIKNEKETISIKKEKNDGYFVITRTDNSIWLDEVELQELKNMIEEIIQISNKRDY